MKKQFNFKNIQGMLSRDEMKQIRGGSGSSFCSTGITCNGSGRCFSYHSGGTEHCCCTVDKQGVNSQDICSV